MQIAYILGLGYFFEQCGLYNLKVLSILSTLTDPSFFTVPPFLTSHPPTPMNVCRNCVTSLRSTCRNSVKHTRLFETSGQCFHVSTNHTHTNTFTITLARWPEGQPMLAVHALFLHTISGGEPALEVSLNVSVHAHAHNHKHAHTHAHVKHTHPGHRLLNPSSLGRGYHGSSSRTKWIRCYCQRGADEGGSIQQSS